MPTITAPAAKATATRTPYSISVLAYSPTYASRIASTRYRLWVIQQEAHDNLTETPRQETRAADDDPLPDLIAGQIGWVHQTVMAGTGRRMLDGGRPAEVSREMPGLLDGAEELLSEKVLNYAVRDA
ncbi:hypothetical protein K377_07663 [Streptomyces sp. PsTaAH-137]|nr:hypothetical protein K377_07663 [Streptomyces sp. PsTaAH-137]